MIFKYLLLTFVLSLGVFISCKKAKEENISYATLDETPYDFSYGSTMSAPNIPGDNKLTIEKVRLGRMLFYEKALSGDGTMNCASCHALGNGFSDTNQFSTGIAGLKGGRQAMAIFNMAWNTNEFFWDGRAHLLRDQALKPIQDPLEMNETLPKAIQKIQAMAQYKVQFTRAFGTHEVTGQRMALALEQFMNSVVSSNSKDDKYLRGELALTASEERGRALFFTEYNPFFPDLSGADCAHCHGGSNFENDQYMNNGLSADNEMTDIGREAVTNFASDRGKFKVTSLRNIAVTGPYMHDGRFKTLEEVVAHYNDGLKPSSTLDPALENTRSTGLMLDAQEQADLVAFLKTLTDYTYLNDSRYKSPF